MLEDAVSSVSSPLTFWESMNSWFTPTVLFLLLNLMIGTIALTSSLTNNNHHKQPPPQPQTDPTKITRSPSVIQRLKSINFYTHFTKPTPDSDTLFAADQTHLTESQSHYFFPTPENTPPVHQHYIFDRSPQETKPQFDFAETKPQLDFADLDDNSIEEEELQSMDEVYSQLKGQGQDGHFNRTKSDTEPASGVVPVKLPAKMRKSASSKSAFRHFEAAEMVEVRRPATVRERGVAKIAEGDEEVDAKADDFINKFKQQLKLQRLDSIIRYKDMIGRGSGATR